MKSTLLHKYFTIGLMLIAPWAFAQSKKAFIKSADEAFGRRDFQSAMTFYEEALLFDSSNLAVAYQTAESARLFNAYSKAENLYSYVALLTAITAAVVGVIVNLALFFGYHVLWPAGLAGRFDWVSAVISLAAGNPLFRYKRSVIQVIAGCAALGLLIKSIH